MRVRIESTRTGDVVRVVNVDTNERIDVARVDWSWVPGEYPIAVLTLPGGKQVNARASVAIDCDAAVVVPEGLRAD
jgi:hypothetical protein